MNNKRKTSYFDSNLQGSLMYMLVILELFMIILAGIYLYYSFNNIFDQNLYKIHNNNHSPIHLQLLIETVKVILVMSSVNFIALLIANYMWLRHVRRIVKFFRKFMLNVESLSLKLPDTSKVPEHDLTQQVILWQKREKQRYKNIKNLIPENSSADLTELKRSINKLKQTLQFSEYLD